MKGTSPKKRTNRAMRRALAGFFVQFVLVACIITVAVFAAEAVDARFGENVAAKSAVMLVVVVFLALLTTVVEHLRRKIAARPVERICAAAKQLAAGDFSVQLEPVHAYGAYDALDEAMEALNAVAAELRQADESRSGFISNVSHELKTPLAVIQSYALALSGAKDEATRAAYCETIVGAAKRLTALVQNVLRLNRLEHHGIRAEFASLRLDELLARCILAFEEQIEHKGLELSCELAEVTVRSDESCLEIVWNNLLSNAVKFTSEGTISVTLRREGDNAVVTVSDTGCGMSAETGKHIFEKFYQGDTSHAAEGNGLGLALVRQVIDLLGGEIAVESAPQKGSTFRVTLYGACV